MSGRTKLVLAIVAVVAIALGVVLGILNRNSDPGPIVVQSTQTASPSVTISASPDDAITDPAHDPLHGVPDVPIAEQTPTGEDMHGQDPAAVKAMGEAAAAQAVGFVTQFAAHADGWTDRIAPFTDPALLPVLKELPSEKIGDLGAPGEAKVRSVDFGDVTVDVPLSGGTTIRCTLTMSDVGTWVVTVYERA